MIPLAFPLASASSFYAALYHSAGSAPDTLTLGLLVLALLLGLAGILTGKGERT